MASQSLPLRVSAFALMLVRCNYDVSPTEDTGTEAQNLATVPEIHAGPGGLALWPSAINVCFRKQINAPPVHPSDPDYRISDSEYNARKTDVMEAIQTTWQAASAVSFASVGECPTGAPPSGTLELFLDTLVPCTVNANCGEGTCSGGRCLDKNGVLVPYENAGVCGFGLDADCSIGIHNNLNVRATAVHEVGHALGFAHEHQRTLDGTTLEQPLCPGEQAKLDFASAHGQATNGWEPVDGLGRWTKYDPISIMSYCGPENRGDPWNANTYWLSDLDNLGIEMYYPRSLSGGIYRDLTVECASGCFRGAGGKILARSDAPVGLGWTVRGALDLVPTWTINGGQLSAEYLQASQFAASPFSTSVTLSDRLARNHATSSSQTIETSTGVHTAIVTTML